MSIQIESFGERARLFTLENSSGTRLVLTDIGASAVSLVWRGTDILLGWEDPDRYFNGEGCHGATIGRVANRVADSRFVLNGKPYELVRNDGKNNLHSGPYGYHRRLWQTAETLADRAVFFMDSPDGDQGYPGRLRLWAGYTLTEDDRVVLDCRAEADADTPVNIVNHAYFNLNGQGSGDILGHRLKIYADTFTPSTADLIPEGDIRPVEGTPFDFRAGHAIGEAINDSDPRLISAHGYDLNFPVPGEGLRPAAELTGDISGIRLTVMTDLPAVQLYTGNFLSGEKGKGGAVYPRHSGVCLETQRFPNALNEPRFPSMILRAGETLSSRTVWALSRAE